MKTSSINAKIKREEQELEEIMNALPSNPIPWGAVVTILGPIIARLAVRYALKRLARNMSEERVNKIAGDTSALIRGIIAKKTATEGL